MYFHITSINMDLMDYTIVGSVSLKKWQNSAFYDRAFKLGGDVLWTNRNDLRYGAKKNLQWTHENFLILAINGYFRFDNLMNTFKHLYCMTKFLKLLMFFEPIERFT